MMCSGIAGGLEYRGRAYRVRQPSCTLKAGWLFVQAEGERCALGFVGVPFPGVSGVAELPGRVWEPGEEELARYADTFAEGGLEVRGRQLWVMGGGSSAYGMTQTGTSLPCHSASTSGTASTGPRTRSPVRPTAWSCGGTMTPDNGLPRGGGRMVCTAAN